MDRTKRTLEEDGFSGFIYKIASISHFARVRLNDCVTALGVPFNISPLVCLPELQRKAKNHIA